MSGVEWTEEEGSFAASVGAYELRVWLGDAEDFGEAEPWRWRVKWNEAGDRYEDSGSTWGDTPEAAQSAAIAAARGLLVEALASVPCDPPVIVTPEGAFALRPDEYKITAARGSATIGHLTPADLVSWGHALLAAGVAARGGG